MAVSYGISFKPPDRPGKLLFGVLRKPIGGDGSAEERNEKERGINPLFSSSAVLLCSSASTSVFRFNNYIKQCLLMGGVGFKRTVNKVFPTAHHSTVD